MRKIMLAAVAAFFLPQPAGAVDIDPDNPVHVLVVARAMAIPCKIKVDKATDDVVASVAVGEWGTDALPVMKNIAFKAAVAFQARTEVEKGRICTTVREMIRK